MTTGASEPAPSGPDEPRRHAWARDRRIRHLFAPPSTTRASIVLFSYLAPIPVLMVLVQLVARLPVTVVAAILLSSLLKGLNNIVHECSHHAFSKHRAFNERVGAILCVLLLMDFTFYKKEHTSHHRFLGDYERDFDFQARRVLRHDQPFRWRRMLRDIVTLRFLWLYVPRIQLKRYEHVAGAAIVGATLIVLYVTGEHQAALAFALAYGVFLPFLKFLIDIVDHGGIYTKDAEELYKSRNFIIYNAALRWLFFPRNDCYHLIHHLYPYLPVKNFSKVHALLMEDPDYRQLRHRATFELSPR